jgi:hypothetical protein
MDGGQHMINIFDEISDVEHSIDRVKENQNRLLDIYDANNKQINNAMKELVDIHEQLEQLEQELVDLSNTNS